MCLKQLASLPPTSIASGHIARTLRLNRGEMPAVAAMALINLSYIAAIGFNSHGLPGRDGRGKARWPGLQIKGCLTLFLRTWVNFAQLRASSFMEP
jgi:hypothetical protein